MKRAIIVMVLGAAGLRSPYGALQAQAPAAGGAAQQNPPVQPASAQTASTQNAASQNAASPVPAAEDWLTGYIDFGYRWRTDVAGSFDTYRSIVNLGSGPKLFGTEFTLIDPKKRWFDQIRVRAYDWGDDPYSSFHLDAAKSKLYDFSADYRDIAYYNFLPSYADPLMSRGIVLDEQAFDQHRRLSSYHLDLLPGNWLIPYLDYSRDSASGTGVSSFVTDTDEFPVPSQSRDLTNLFRGGLRLELRRLHVTVEEGGTTFKDDESLYQAGGPPNQGNNLTPYFGQPITLASGLGAYGIRGTSTYTKALFTANPASWVDLYGQFLFSQPESAVNYQQVDSGNLVVQSQVLFYSAQQFLLTSAAKMPHTAGSFGGEIRPLKHIRIVESWMTDRLHDNGQAASTQNLIASGSKLVTAALLQSTLATDYSQNEIQVYWDPVSRLTLHGGYRYVWGDANDAFLPVAGLDSADSVKLRRNVAIGGLTYRPIQKLTLSGEAEGGSSGGAYFRTSLYDYQKIRAQARYQVTGSLNLAADFSLINNQNPSPGVNYDYLAHQVSLSFFWMPSSGKRWTFQGSYTRSTIYSDIGYLDPGTLQPLTSLYRDNAHMATGLFDLKLPQLRGRTPRLTAGGSFFISSGSRPTNYYQPLIKTTVPLAKHVDWFAEWRYYGYGEAFYLFEGFRTHVVFTGLRLTR